jgi:hypothetical protein
VPDDPCRRLPASVRLRRFHQLGPRAPSRCARTELVSAR